MTRKLFTPDRITFTAFDTCGIELQRKADRLHCRCQQCHTTWELSFARLNQTAAVSDWQCLNGCNAGAERRSKEQYPDRSTLARSINFSLD